MFHIKILLALISNAINVAIDKQFIGIAADRQPFHKLSCIFAAIVVATNSTKGSIENSL
jgi:hypothetical protein